MRTHTHTRAHAHNLSPPLNNMVTHTLPLSPPIAPTLLSRPARASSQLMSSFRVYCAAAVLGDTVLFHGGHNIMAVRSDLHMVIPADELVYDAPQQEFPLQRAYAAITFSRSPDRVVIHGGFNGQFALSDLWVLDFPTKTWAHVRDVSPLLTRFGHFVHGSGNKYYFGFGASLLRLFDDMFVFDFSTFDWSRVDVPAEYAHRLSRIQPVTASYSPATGLDGPFTHMLYFGGVRVRGIADGAISESESLNDLWILDTSDAGDVRWREVQRQAGAPWPAPRSAAAAAAVVTPTTQRLGVFVYGGMASKDGTGYTPSDMPAEWELLEDSWVFWVDTETWQQLELSGPGPGPRIGHALAFVENHVMLYGGSQHKPAGQDVLGIASISATNDVWTVDVAEFEADSAHSSERRRAAAPVDPSDASGGADRMEDLPGEASQVSGWLTVPSAFAASRMHHFAFGFNNTLFVWGGRDETDFLSTNLMELPLGCLQGFYSETGAFADCKPCPQGTFQREVGQSFCAACPDRVTTTGPGALSLSQCIACEEGHCEHGSCSVNERLLPVCSCDFGYDGNRCQHNVAVFVALTTLASILSLGLFWSCLVLWSVSVPASTFACVCVCVRMCACLCLCLCLCVCVFVSVRVCPPPLCNDCCDMLLRERYDSHV